MLAQLGYGGSAVDGVAYEECWPSRVAIDIGGLTVPFIDVHHLVINKRSSGRLQDLADVQALADDEPDQDEDPA